MPATPHDELVVLLAYIDQELAETYKQADEAYLNFRELHSVVQKITMWEALQHKVEAQLRPNEE